MPIEIGTSMLVCRASKARHADLKNGRPEYAAAGKAINADSQWKKSRCSGIMSLTLPDHTGTDSIMMFIAAKAATPRQRSRKLACAASSVSARTGSNG